MERFVISSGKRLIWMLGAVHTVAWLFKLDELITTWASTHVAWTVCGIVLFLIFAWHFWDTQRLRFRTEVMDVALETAPK